MKKKMTPYILLVPQLILGVVFIIGLGTGIIQSLGVIPAFGLTEPTLKYYKEVLTRPDLLQSLKYSLYIAFMSAFLATVTGTFLCAVLGISYICWYVSGRHTGVVTFLFCKDNTG